MIRILVDSSADYELPELKDMEFIPITVTLDEKDYRDGLDLNKNQLYEMLDGTTFFQRQHSHLRQNLQISLKM